MGYGPARVYSASEVVSIHAALDRLPEAELRSRFSPSDMKRKKIYPDICSRPLEVEDNLGYLMEHMAELRESVKHSVDNRLGLVVYIS